MRLAIALAIFSSVKGQRPCAETNFAACKTDAETFKAATCVPLNAQNATYYQHCLCYAAVNNGYCFGQCPDDPSIKGEFAQSEQVIASTCASASLNPKALPQPPIWQKSGFVTTTTTTTTTTAAKTATATATAKSSAHTNLSNLMMLSGALLAVF
jgi:hypothetical protein